MFSVEMNEEKGIEIDIKIARICIPKSLFHLKMEQRAQFSLSLFSLWIIDKVNDKHLSNRLNEEKLKIEKSRQGKPIKLDEINWIIEVNSIECLKIRHESLAEFVSKMKC